MTNRDIILQSIGIIESRLKAEVTVSDVARKAGYSLFHFIRLFQGVTGCTPKDYILQRKLSEAAKDIHDTDRKIVDIAFDYGFQSHETFSRAFRRQFGKKPSDFRRNGNNGLFSRLSAFAPASFDREVEAETRQPELVEMGELTLIGMMTNVAGDTSVISDLWARFFPEAARIANRDQPEKYYQLTFRPEEDCEDGFFCMAAMEALHLDSIPIMSFLKSPSPR